jgi:hypothetical protein
MLRPALILLTLFLASCVSSSAQEKQSPHAAVFHPTTFICDPPAWPGGQRQPIPPGKKIEDLCPPGAHAYLFYDPFPRLSHIPPPLGLDTAGPQKPQPDTGSKSP